MKISMFADRLKLSDLEDADIKGRRVLMRVDYGRHHEAGVAASIPTIERLLRGGVKSIVISNTRYPKKIGDWTRFSADKSASLLTERLRREVQSLEGSSVIGHPEYLGDLAEGSIVVVDYLNFYRSDSDQASLRRGSIELSKVADIYVNEAFSMSHIKDGRRKGIAIRTRAAGLAFEKSLVHLTRAVEAPERPVLGIVASRAIGRSVDVIVSLLDIVDTMIISGDMAVTFFDQMNGKDVKVNGVLDKDALVVPWIIQQAEKKNVRLIFPSDFVCVDKRNSRGIFSAYSLFLLSLLIFGPTNSKPSYSRLSPSAAHPSPWERYPRPVRPRAARMHSRLALRIPLSLIFYLCLRLEYSIR